MPHGIASFCPIQYRSCGSAGTTLHLCASTPHAPSFSIGIADAPLLSDNPPEPTHSHPMHVHAPSLSIGILDAPLLSDNRPEPTHPHPMYQVRLRTPLCHQTFPPNPHVVNSPYTTNYILAYAEVLFCLKFCTSASSCSKLSTRS